MFTPLTVHELGHTAFQLPDEETDPTDIMFQNVQTVVSPNATNVSEAQVLYGAPQTNAELVGTGMPLGEIYSAYMGARNAAPDNAGLMFWNSAINVNPALFATLCADLVGTVQATTAQVTQYYQNVLGRAPDAPGLAFWSRFSAAQALAGLCGSAEAGGLRATQFANGLWFS
jgi:hypothetical protein